METSRPAVDGAASSLETRIDRLGARPISHLRRIAYRPAVSNERRILPTLLPIRAPLDCATRAWTAERRPVTWKEMKSDSPDALEMTVVVQAKRQPDATGASREKRTS